MNAAAMNVINRTRTSRVAALVLFPLLTLSAQVPNPTQRQIRDTPDGNQPITVFRVDVVSRTMKAINFHHRQGSTMVDFKGTQLEPEAKGDAKVDSKTGATKVTAHFSHLEPAARFGSEFVTYVLWAITPEGRASNLGEVFLEGSNASLQAATDLQAFGLMVTAEPYYAVTQPSDVVVMENFVREDTTGTIEQVDAKFELIQRGVYTRNMTSVLKEKMKLDPHVPLDIQEARNAYAIATNVGAQTYAADTMRKAELELQNAEGYLTSGRDKKMLQTVARQSTQMSEDARIITLKKMDEIARAQSHEREVSATQEAALQARERASADASRMEADQLRMKADQERMKADQERMKAEAAKTAAEDASRRADMDRATAEAARMAALEQQKRLEAETANAHAAADEANRLRMAAEAEKAALREQIRTQLNLILETRDTARGLIVNMSDVLFDTGKFTLRPGAKEKLAKVSGILLAHPGLQLEVEGHTDSVGGDDYNQKLSEHRAGSVRDYLVGQGIMADAISSKGLGKTTPVATNDTAVGRQQNRRVELVVSGDAITKKVTTTSDVR